jgi:integrase
MFIGSNGSSFSTTNGTRPRWAKNEVAQFLSSLARELHVSASTQNQALNAILFLYREVLRKEIGYVDGVIRAKKSRPLPVVLTKEEVKTILGRLSGARWLMSMLLYGAELRLMECCRLRVKDIDFLRTRYLFERAKETKTGTPCFLGRLSSRFSDISRR